MTRKTSRDIHPDERTTASYLEGSLTTAERERVEAHLVACGSCRAGVVLLKTGGAGEGLDDPAAPARVSATATPSGSRRSSRFWWLAAAVVLVGAALVVWRIRPAPPGLVYRAEETRDFGTVTPGGGSVVRSGDLIFTWQAVEGADRYQVEVTAATGETLVTIDVAADRLSAHWPAGSPPPPAGPLVYRLRALAFDQVIAQTEPLRIHVR